jgi:hypothetical protein
LQLTNDYSIEDPPNNGNYDAALESLTGAANLLIKAGKTSSSALTIQRLLPHPV